MTIGKLTCTLSKTSMFLRMTISTPQATTMRQAPGTAHTSRSTPVISPDGVAQRLSISTVPIWRNISIVVDSAHTSSSKQTDHFSQPLHTRIVSTRTPCTHAYSPPRFLF